VDAAAAGLVDDDLGVGIQAVVGCARVEPFVDRVLALHREDRDAAEAELLVEGDRLLVVVQHREVHEGGAAGLKVFGEAAHEALAKAGMRGLRADGEAPERRAALGILEGAHVVDAHDGAEDLAGLGVLGDQHDERAGVAMAPEEVGRHGHHVAGGIDGVDGLGIGGIGEAADEESLPARPRGAVGREVEPVGVRGVEEELLGRHAEEDVRVADVKGDVAAVRPLGAQGLAQRLGCLEGLGEDEPAPAAIGGDVLGQVALAVDRRLQAGRAHAAQPVVVAAAGVGVAHLRSRASGATSRGARPARARSPGGG
jgi:hypothetical protein